MCVSTIRAKQKRTTRTNKHRNRTDFARVIRYARASGAIDCARHRIEPEHDLLQSSVAGREKKLQLQVMFYEKWILIYLQRARLHKLIIFLKKINLNRINSNRVVA